MREYVLFVAQHMWVLVISRNDVIVMMAGGNERVATRRVVVGRGSIVAAREAGCGSNLPGRGDYC